MTAFQDQLIEASAGAGKTTLLVQKYLAIFEEKPHLNPQQVLAITFTKLAATEMLNRISTQKLPDSLAQNLNKCWITTIHGFCHDILKIYSPSSLKLSHFDILEPDAQKLMIHRAIQETLNQMIQENNSQLNKYLSEHPLHQLFYLIKKCFYSPQGMLQGFQKNPANTLCRLYEDLISSQVAAAAQSELAQLGYIFERAWAHFCQLKQESYCLDYDDLIQECSLLLKNNPAIRHELQDYLAYIMVDEFQDTSEIEWAFIQNLVSDSQVFGNHKLFLVGDRWQSIYGFRGGNNNLFERLIQQEEGKALVLKQDNYRSDPKIIQWINIVFSRLSEQNPLPFRPISPHKKGKLEHPISIAMLAQSDRLGILEQLEVVIQDMKALQTQIPFSKMAIILRKKKHAKQCQEALNAAGIPTRLQLGIALFQQAPILALTHLLHLLYNPKQSHHFCAFVLSGWIGLPKKALVLFKEALHTKLWANDPKAFKQLCRNLTHCIGAEALERLLVFCDLLQHYPPLIYQYNPRQLLVKILEELSPFEGIEDSHLHQALLDHFLDKLSAWWQQSAKHPWLNFLELLAFQIANPEQSQITLNDAAFSGVQILSIHAAKGLEFEAVYLLETEAGFNYDSSNPLLLAPNGEIAYSFQKNKVKNPLRSQLQKSIKAKIIQEEKHLFYVAATRAKSRLMICASEPKRKQDSMLNLMRSISQDTCKEWVFSFNNESVAIPVIKEISSPQDGAIVQAEKKTNATKTVRGSLPTHKDAIQKVSFRQLFKSKQRISSQKSFEGTLMHQCLENICRYPFKALDLLLPPLQNNTNQCMHWLQTFARSPLYTQILKAQKVLLEFPFQIQHKRLLVTGRIDLALILNDQKGLLVDFKSHAPQHFQDLYRQQLSLYSLGLLQQFPDIEFETALYLADSGQLQKIIPLQGSMLWESINDGELVLERFDV